MINYDLNDGDLVRGRDIRTIIEEVNANEISGDGITITVDKNEGGTSIQVIDQFGGGSGDGSTQSVFPILISSGSNGVYKGFVIDSVTGEPAGESITVIASRATAYDLATDNRIVGVLIPTTTA